MNKATQLALKTLLLFYKTIRPALVINKKNLYYINNE